MTLRADLPVPGEVKWIVDRLEAAGFEAWTVGGAVRDALAGGEPEDWDIATSARPGEVRRIFRRTVPIGIEHGTVGVLGRSGRMYEVTTFRRDVETFGRKARVEFADRLEDDLDRRDFSINAVAWHPRTGEVRDPHGGVTDLRNRVLRTVGPPDDRFAEDRLRVLRALRFAGRFDLRIEEETWAALVRSSDKLGLLSAERVREELWKVLVGQRYPSRSLRLYGDSGVLGALFPELERCRAERTPEGGSVWDRVLRAVDAAPQGRPTIRLAALLHRVGEGTDPGEAARASAAIAREMLRRLRFSNAVVDSVSHLVAQSAPVPSPDASEAELRTWLRRIGREYANDLFRLLFAICRASSPEPNEARALRTVVIRARRELSAGVPLSVGELAIGGEELKRLGVPPGPAYGEILRWLLDEVTVTPELNSREQLLRLVRDHWVTN